MKHTTLCYIHSGTYSDSPYQISYLWEYKSHNLTNLRYNAYQLSYRVTTKEWISKLAPIAHAKLWNDTKLEKNWNGLSFNYRANYHSSKNTMTQKQMFRKILPLRKQVHRQCPAPWTSHESNAFFCIFVVTRSLRIVRDNTNECRFVMQSGVYKANLNNGVKFSLPTSGRRVMSTHFGPCIHPLMYLCTWWKIKN